MQAGMKHFRALALEDFQTTSIVACDDHNPVSHTVTVTLSTVFIKLLSSLYPIHYGCT